MVEQVEKLDLTAEGEIEVDVREVKEHSVEVLEHCKEVLTQSKDIKEA